MKSLFSIQYAGLLLAAPLTCAAPQSCTGMSLNGKAWTIKDFDYHASYIFSTPSHQNSHGYVNFTLHNNALAYEGACSATSSWLQDFFYGSVVYDCQIPAGSEPGEGDKATFTFSYPSGELKINQTWTCPYEGSHWTATGGVTLDLNCKEDKWQNPDWQMGEFYSTRDITCDKVTVDAPLEITSGPA